MERRISAARNNVLTGTNREPSMAVAEGHLRFEELLYLSSGFPEIRDNAIKQKIQEALKGITSFFRASNCILTRFPTEADRAAIMYSARSGHGSPPAGIDFVPSLPWISKRLQGGEVIRFSTPDELPAEADSDRITCSRWGICSALIVPILISAKTRYSIAILSQRQTRACSEACINRVQLLGQVLANGVENKLMGQEIRKTVKEWQLTLDSVQDLVVILDNGLRIVRINSAALSFSRPRWKMSWGKTITACWVGMAISYLLV